MACFLVPVAESVVVKAVEKHVEKKEESVIQENETSAGETAVKIPLSVKLRWLTWMLWGGAVLLAFEHLWHGEVTLSFPFLTAVSEGPEATSAMLSEMATSGVAMALLVTLVWAGMVAVSAVAENRAAARPAKKEEAQP